MSTELLYTSAPKGLRHGSRGFCTVLTTSGMPINVIGKLESISGYRHLFPPDSPRAGENPVTQAHQRVSLGGQLVSVISRIAAYGTDYSGRTNKLAHHVALDASELPQAGPAWLLQQPTVMRSQWYGQCETPPTGPSIPRGDQPPRICSSWKSVTGDAGWGGVVAEAFAADAGQPFWIVYSLDHQDRLLEMMDESISLLPPSQRWRATFNTFAVNVPPDVDCRVRMVPAGTEEARFATSAGKCVDLTRTQSITTASQWVERARGKLRGDGVSVGTSTGFSAVQDPVDSEGASVWSSSEESASGPPPTPQPPALPDQLRKHSGGRLWWSSLAVIVALLMLSGIWCLSRYWAGLPLLPGGASKPAAPLAVAPPDASVTEPVVSETEEQPTVPTQRLEFPVRYDQKQMLGWVLGNPDAETPLPSPISLRGRLNLPSTLGPRESGETVQASVADPSPVSNAPGALNSATASDGGQASSDRENARRDSAATTESAFKATLIAWGGKAVRLPPAESVRIESTSLANIVGTFQVHPIPDVDPALSASTRVYWRPEGDDLIAISGFDWHADGNSSGDAASGGQAAAYRTVGQSLANLSALFASLQQQSAELPSSFRSIVAPLVLRGNRGRESLVRSLLRSADDMDEIIDEAMAVTDQMQAEVAGQAGPLNKSQQDALLRAVSDCERIVRSAQELEESFHVLQQGWTVDVADLRFQDSDGDLIRRLPLRFHFSW
ncbi:hypothetical protein FYK55_22800 [Roseiconus nitratireducens]|uniref:Uncharacterized protein n=1 Tax=Roseiconus nitratireducens TaxID=2605748 RepID=A0A5M6CXF0_9BACT|nr:hypothetical protein [Roseiconus nitratireducens]KAA5539881.1 hypothetical protein FYK55_22800 [Roseiconus nitratireducens]